MYLIHSARVKVKVFVVSELAAGIGSLHPPLEHDESIVRREPIIIGKTGEDYLGD